MIVVVGVVRLWKPWIAKCLVEFLVDRLQFYVVTDSLSLVRLR